MKAYSKFLTALIALLLIAGISGCQEENSGLSNSSELADDIPEMAIQDIEEESGGEDIEEEANMENELKLKPQRKKAYLSLRKIIIKMELSEDQIDAVKGYIIEYHETIKDWRIEFYKERLEIWKWATEERLAILEALENGEITKEEAREKLREINKEAKEKIKELRQAAYEKMKEQREELLEKIASVLNDEQLEMWEEWLESLPWRQ